MSKILRGVGAAPGIATGPVFISNTETLQVERKQIADTQQEIARLTVALQKAEQQIQELAVKAQEQASAEEASIFEAHALFLSDPELLELVHGAINEQQVSADYAWQEATKEYANQLRSLDDEYLAARAIDLEDVAQRVLAILLGKHSARTELTEPVVIVAHDLTPSETLQFQRDKVKAFCIAAGGPTSHVAILARALGLPAITGLGEKNLQALEDGKLVIVDGGSGEVFLEPSVEQQKQYEQKMQQQVQIENAALAVAKHAAQTKDGHTVEVVANIENPAQVEDAVENGAEGIGLLRTEFLFMERDAEPNEQEQEAIYRSILEAIARVKSTKSEVPPVVVRTFDIGGDKPLAYLKQQPEENPFLGLRGVRLAFAYPEMLQTQLRALLRVSVGQNLKIMFPMVTSKEEVLAIREQVAQAKEILKAERSTFAEKVEIGIMIEVPAAALMVDVLAPHVDFFSIGTNDLTQYTMAVDRGNAEVAHLANAHHPAVLRLIQQVVMAAHRHGKWVGVCGELGGDVLATPILLGMGVDELSMTSRRIPLVKQKIRELTLTQAQSIAEHVLTLGTAQEVKEYMTSL